MGGLEDGDVAVIYRFRGRCYEHENEHEHEVAGANVRGFGVGSTWRLLFDRCGYSVGVVVAVMVRDAK